MVKGVNRQIIEVNRLDSIYFERAVFYLRPGVTKLPDEITRNEIERCITAQGMASRRLKRGRTLIYAALGMVCLVMIFALVR